MAKKNLANNKVILAMGVGIATMLAMPMYANAAPTDEEGAEPIASKTEGESSESTTTETITSENGDYVKETTINVSETDNSREE